MYFTYNIIATVDLLQSCLCYLPIRNFLDLISSFLELVWTIMPCFSTVCSVTSYLVCIFIPILLCAIVSYSMSLIEIELRQLIDSLESDLTQVLALIDSIEDTISYLLNQEVVDQEVLANAEANLERAKSEMERITSAIRHAESMLNNV